MDFNNYSYDKDLAENGRVVDLDESSSLTVCRWGNKRFMACYGELMKPHGFNNQQFGRFENSVPQEEQTAILMEVVAKTILIGWTGMTDDGEEIEYSPESALRIFKKHEVFLIDVINLAKEDATFRIESMEEELEKPEPSSSTSSESAEQPASD